MIEDNAFRRPTRPTIPPGELPKADWYHIGYVTLAAGVITQATA